jgi:tRNA A-37 threonylcarbamoyl transferase component Bud32
MDYLSGRRLGAYELRQQLGSGGMGAVFLGVHTVLGQTRAIKVLPPQMALDRDFLERFRREARLAAALDHPNIVPIYDIGEADGFHYIVMKLLEGEPLDVLARARGPLPLPRSLAILAQLAAALDFAHARGVVHRDLKPPNVMVGPGDRVTLLDFGIARSQDGTGLTGSGMVVGTAGYMAPEALWGRGSGPSVDRYALGVIAYELFTGRTPFAGMDTPQMMFAHAHTPPPPPRTLRSDLSPAVEAVLLRQLAKDPERRFPSCAGFVEALGTMAAPLLDLPRPPAGAPARPAAPAPGGVERTGEPFPLPPAPSPPERPRGIADQASATPAPAPRTTGRAGGLASILGAGLVAGLLTGALVAVAWVAIVLLGVGLGESRAQEVIELGALSGMLHLWIVPPLIAAGVRIFEGVEGGILAVFVHLVFSAGVGLLFAVALRRRGALRCVAAGLALNLLAWLAAGVPTTGTFIWGWGGLRFSDSSAELLGLGLALGLVLQVFSGVVLGLTYALARGGLTRIFRPLLAH